MTTLHRRSFTVIVAGGRDYALTDDDRQYLSSLGITELWTGGCRGVDEDAESWAKWNEIPVKTYPANWVKHGRSAGPRRNKRMAQELQGNTLGRVAVVLFPGGRGTESMRREAKKAGLVIMERCRRRDVQMRKEDQE